MVSHEVWHEAFLMEEVACREDDGKVQAPHEAAIDPFYGKRGMGFVHDPKHAVRGAIYRRTTFFSSTS